MQSFEYYAPTKIYFGKQRHKEIGEIIKNYGFKKVLLHYGMGSVKTAGIYDEVIQSLKDNNIDFVELGGVEPNPKLSLVEKGVDLCVKENVDFVLALGGGSVIDSTKLIAMSAKNNGTSPWDFVVKKAVAKDGLQHGVILTIAAAGSEMSASCVITKQDEKLKRGFLSELNRPLFSILNPELTYTVSPFQTACGVVDILMHTFERYFQPGQDANLTEDISHSLMRNVIDAGVKVMKTPKDYASRSTLMWASSLSHNDLTGAGKNPGLAVHQLEHEVSGEYDQVAHAAGLSVLFPAWAKYVYKNNVMKFCKFAVNVWGCEMNFENPEITAFEGIEKCKSYFKDTLKMPVTLNELEIGDDKLDLMAQKCTFNQTRTIPGVMELGKNEILDIYKIALN